MKTKLEMAHEWYMMQTRRNGCALVADAWKYADAMQAAADEREKKDQEKLKQDDRNHHDALVEIGLEEWQPDWSQAPVWASWWSFDENGTANFSGKKPNIEGRQWVYYSAASENLCHIEAPSFGYTGDWRNSLRKRPK